MTPSQLLEMLTKSGLIDEPVLERIRQEVANSTKHVKSAAIIKFLIKKGQLTKAQGEKFLSGEWKAPAQLADDPQFEVAPTADKPDYDTDDLTNLDVAETPPGNERSKTPPPPPSKADSKKGSKQSSAKAPTKDAGKFADKGTRVYREEDLDGGDTPDVDFGPGPQKAAVIAGADPFADLNPPSPSGAAAANLDEVGPAPGDGHGAHAFVGKKDQTDQWKTKWLFIASGALAILLIVGAVLVLAVFQAEPEELYKAAESSYVAGTYGDAMVKFRDYYERFPKHDHASQAKVREVQCMLWGPFESKNYNETYKVALEKIPTIVNEPAADLIKDDYSVWFPDIVLDFSEKALQQSTIETMEEGLKKAEESKQVLDFMTQAQKRTERVAPILEKIENNLLTVKGLIEKEKSYDASLIEINALAAENKTDRAFQVYNRLTRTYGDLAARQPLREAMMKVTEREITLVKPAEVAVTTSSTDLPSVVDQTMMLTTRIGASLPSIQDELLPMLIEGNVYVLSGRDGSVLWSRFVGYETAIRPIWTDANARTELLLVDERLHQVMRVDAKTGQLSWRAEIGEPFVAPTLRGDMMYLATRSGTVMRFNATTGEQMAAAQLPKRVSVPLEVAEQDPFLYVVGDDANIYILGTEELNCVEAFYLGHAPGDVKIAPIYWSGHLLCAVSGSDYCDLHVLRVGDNGFSLERLQLIRLADSPVSTTPLKLGRNMLFVSDRGGLELMEMVTSEVEAPMMRAAQEKVEYRGDGRAFVTAQGSNMWVASKGLTSFRINKNAGQFERKSITSSSDTFLAPMQKIENVLIHARRRGGSRQISVSAVDATTLEEFWRSDFGAPLAGAPVTVGDRVMAISSQGDTFDLSKVTETFASVPQSTRASDIDQALNFTELVRLGDGRVTAISDGKSSDMLSVDFTEGRSRLSRMLFNNETISLAASPVKLSQDFVVPSLSGLILRIDENGRSVGAPFAPPLGAGETVQWRRPVSNAADRILVADEKQNVFLLDASQRGSLAQVGALALDAVIISPLAGNENFGYGIAELNGKATLRKFPFAEPFAEAAKVDLPARPVAGPFIVGGQVLAHLDDGRLYAWDLDGQPLWNREMPNDSIAHAFDLDGSSMIYLLLERGAVLAIDQQGDLTKTLELGFPVRHEPVFTGDRVYFTSANGAVLVVDRGQLQ